MAGEYASLARLHGQSLELTQPASEFRSATSPPQHPSPQSRSPQLLLQCLYASAGDAKAMLEGFSIGEDAGHEGCEGSVVQGGELVEECLQGRAQDASIERFSIGKEKDQTEDNVLDLRYTML